MAKPYWVFERSARMGGAAGEAYSNILASSGMHPAGVLAREAIQNSVDAKAPGIDKVSVSFIGKALTGSEKAEFIEYSSIGQMTPRYGELKFKEPNCLQHLDDPESPINLLYIEDRGTTGLEGDPAEPDSKFYKFLLSLGDGGKEHDEHGTGGSYGYGKSVYSSSSSILTIWAYSRTTLASGEEQSLLFGCGYYRKHKSDSTHFTGRAWFGSDETGVSPDAPQVVAPLSDASFQFGLWSIEASDELSLPRLDRHNPLLFEGQPVGFAFDYCLTFFFIFERALFFTLYLH